MNVCIVACGDHVLLVFTTDCSGNTTQTFMGRSKAPPQDDPTKELRSLVRKEFRRVRELYCHGYLEVLKRLMSTPSGEVDDAIKEAEDDVLTLRLFVTLNAEAMQRIIRKLETRLALKEGYIASDIVKQQQDGALMPPHVPSERSLSGTSVGVARRRNNSPSLHATPHRRRRHRLGRKKSPMGLRRKSPMGSRTPLLYVNDDPILKELRGEIAMAVSKIKLTTRKSESEREKEYKLYWQRWWVLTVFSLLSLFNNVVCFTFAPINTASKQYYGTQVNLGHLVAFFFVAYIIFSFPSSRFVDQYGLRWGILLGAWLQVIGNFVRCLGHRVISDAEFPCVLMGQLIASLAQPFFVNPPPLIAATWFGVKERTLATTVAVNSNQFGIAVAYFLAPMIVHAPEDIPNYLDLLTLLSLILALAATLYFPSEPPTPPSRSKALGVSSGGANEDDDDEGSDDSENTNWGLAMWQQCVGLFFATGFARTVLVFGVAEATINSYCTFLNSLLVPRGFTKQFVSYMGILFISTCMVASGPSAYIVDKTRAYKTAVILCLVGLALSIVWIVYATNSLFTTLAIAAAGVFVGPIQPVVMELAAQITYPAPEELMATVQQVAGNCMSVIMFLVIDAIHNPELSMYGILICVGVVIAVFFNFHAVLVRDDAEEATDSGPKSRIRVETWKERALKDFLPQANCAESKSIEPLAGGLGPANPKASMNYGSLAERTSSATRASRGKRTTDDIERAPLELKQTTHA
mmetsp:Transcript_38297/g.73661  ORF Transcript_38297/g.73661 Transcript_38297/m.73661 type:complete len:748 (-) Transcript_38297:221-2464(-)